MLIKLKLNNDFLFVYYFNIKNICLWLQGLNYIAGLLLLATKNEEISFWLLIVLIEEKLPDYYCSTMDGVIVDIEVFSRLVQ